ncbi:YheT family hydrolase [Ruegeria halocynthiae]|uniref:YheT family hydrolase n=1 Tax=Ruegeria halocynthiae TaxID=985054 RepID=UPI000AB4CB4C|nr:alpha/beta fold hydrolase [Ruegeria halocynthiae]
MDRFAPPTLLRPAMVQTALASARFRKSRSAVLEAASRHVTLDVGAGLQTTCLYAPNPAAKGLVILLHGWLGTPQSAYVVSTAKYLYAQGYSVCRMTLPEHGDAIALNSDFLHAARTDELYRAVEQVAAWAEAQPVGLVGYSLGGNFALRVARGLRDRPIPQLTRIYAVSPLFNPASAAVMIDGNPLLRSYFTRKLRKWLRDKNAAFPDQYPIADILGCSTITDMSHLIVGRWTGFAHLSDYFAAYQLAAGDMRGCPLPLTIFGAHDDPVVDAADVAKLRDMSGVDLHLSARGGHNGFCDTLAGPSYFDRVIAQTLPSTH